ncbi:MAG: hypothetical protein ACQESP_06945 [Candidatus Muiribacteriota bacterium]
MKNKKILLYILISIFFFNYYIFAEVSLPGPTGFLNVPSPYTTPSGTFEGGFHYQSYNYGGSSSYGISSFKANVGVTKNLEIGFEKTMDSGRLLSNLGMVVSAKSGWSVNDEIHVAGGVIVDTGSGNYSSIYGLFGAENAFFGMGFNFGGSSGPIGGTAKMGGYDLQEKRPDKVFFISGAKFEFGGNGGLTVGYNGDTVTLGFIAELDDQEFNSTVEVGWLVEGDYKDYYKNLVNSNYERNPMFFGISGRW